MSVKQRFYEESNLDETRGDLVVLRGCHSEDELIIRCSTDWVVTEDV